MPSQLDGYETVAERIEKFWTLYPAGRISTEIVYQDGQRYIVRCDLYRDVVDLIPYATDFAEEVRSNTNRFPLENASTSSIGRSLHTSGLSKFSEGVARPSYEEMKRVTSLTVVQDAADSVVVERDPWSFGSAIDSTVAHINQALSAAPTCAHGERVWKEGESARGKYAGWVCSEKDKDKQCKAIWLKLTPDGRWA